MALLLINLEMVIYATKRGGGGGGDICYIYVNTEKVREIQKSL